VLLDLYAFKAPTIINNPIFLINKIFLLAKESVHSKFPSVVISIELRCPKLRRILYLNPMQVIQLALLHLQLQNSCFQVFKF
jgi:hypothetical protein